MEKRLAIACLIIVFGWVTRPLASEKKQPAYEGQLLTHILLGRNVADTNEVTLDKLLTLKQTVAGDVAVFELPVSYDVVTNMRAYLRLFVDGDSEDKKAERQGIGRATNGNAKIVWDTAFDAPGKNFIHAQLAYSDAEEWVEVKGPNLLFNSTNLCKLDSFYNSFTRESGATLYAELVESNATYTIELKLPQGKPFKTFTGSTSNGVIQVDWSLVDEKGYDYSTNRFIVSTFRIRLSDSGRSQMLEKYMSHFGNY